MIARRFMSNAVAAAGRDRGCFSHLASGGGNGRIASRVRRFEFWRQDRRFTRHNNNSHVRHISWGSNLYRFDDNDSNQSRDGRAVRVGGVDRVRPGQPNEKCLPVALVPSLPSFPYSSSFSTISSSSSSPSMVSSRNNVSMLSTVPSLSSSSSSATSFAKQKNHIRERRGIGAGGSGAGDNNRNHNGNENHHRKNFATTGKNDDKTTSNGSLAPPKSAPPGLPPGTYQKVGLLTTLQLINNLGFGCVIPVLPLFATEMGLGASGVGLIIRFVRRIRCLDVAIIIFVYTSTTIPLTIP